MRWVDWCDAFAYCAASGKRLCGKIGGGVLAYGAGGADDPMQSEWLNACTAGGTQDYPYGSIYQPGFCYEGDINADAPIAVGQLESCEGGYPGLFDMAGNLAEWLDTCDSDVGDVDHCYLAGGSYFEVSGDYRCARTLFIARGVAAGIAGIRCCTD